MWFLLQLIDHEVHESNEVTGQSLGAGPGGSGLWGPLPLSPNPLLTTPPIIVPPGREGGGELPGRGHGSSTNRTPDFEFS